MIDVAAVGDVADINCWSNIPFYFFHEGLKENLFTNPWNLNLDRFNDSRRYWNILNLLSMNKLGGYQYSTSFLDKAERSIPAEFFSHTIISFNQLFPRAETVKKAGGKIIYYIDMTLADLFADVSYGVKVGSEIKRKALNQETVNYNLAERVITMGNWPLKTLRDYYDLPESKLGFILPGANISLTPSWKPSIHRAGAGKSRELVMGFIGKDWERKGLNVLVDVKRELQRRGFKVRLKIIGGCPPQLQSETGIEFLGMINKVTDSARFISEIADCDIGCLFSRGEALGISLLEFLAVGVPVAGYYHQGMKDTLLPGASLQFNLNDSLSDIIERFVAYIDDSDSQHSLKSSAVASMNSVTWSACVKNWSPILEAL